MSAPTRAPYLVPADEVRRHILFLRRRGLTCAGIAKLAELSPTTVQKCYLGQSRFLQRRTAEAILGVSTGAVHDDMRTSSEHVRRLLRAMTEAGIERRDVARWLGMTCDELSLARRPSVYGRTLRRVVTLYRLLAGRGRVPAEPLQAIPECLGVRRS